MPKTSNELRDSMMRLSTAINGRARLKLPAVLAVALLLPRPRSEYTPQATPAIIIKIAPSSGGADSPGNIRPINPVQASINPANCTRPSRSPRHRPQPIIVACTAPKSSRAPDGGGPTAMLTDSVTTQPHNEPKHQSTRGQADKGEACGINMGSAQSHAA